MHWLIESIQFLEASRMNDVTISKLQFSHWIEWKSLTLKKNIDESIYKQILKINEIDENCTLLREAIARDEAQYKDTKLRDCRVQNEILYRDNLL